MNNPFFNNLDSLDKIIEKGPLHSDFKTMIAPILANEAAQRYFYDQIKAPEWLKVLKENGEFNAPPLAEEDKAKGTTSYPVWPPSSLLNRMSPVSPNVVLEIITNMPLTNNCRVHADLVEALANMPSKLATKATDKVINWIESTNKHWYPDKYALLINHLADGNETKSAIKISYCLLKLLPDPRKEETQSPEGEILRYRKSPVTRFFDKWQYGNTLKAILPKLTNNCRVRALVLFCDLLEEATKLTLRKASNSQEEIFYEGPRAIEDHEQNRVHNKPIDQLVFAVRDVATELIEEEGKDILSTIESKDYKVFKRIELYLRTIWPEVDFEGTIALMSNPEIYEDSDLHHEIFHLLRTVFGNLPPKSQSTYYDYIEQIPNTEWFKEYCKDKPKNEIARIKRGLEFEQLIPIKKYLAGKWKQRFKKLSGEFKESEHPDFLYYIGPVEDVSTKIPKTSEDLGSLDTDKLIEYLKDYEPTSGPLDSSLEGLAGELESLLTTDPNKYASIAEYLLINQPVIVRNYLSGVQKAVKSEHGINSELWLPVLNLCSWIVNQPRDEKIRKDRDSDLDPGWGWTRKTIAVLIEDGLKSEKSKIPFSLRNTVKNILLILTQDPEPTTEREAESHRPANLSINTVRGQAMHAVIQYALWIYRELDKTPDGKKELAKGFDSMSEVQKMLDAHLDLEKEPSLAIRSVYGQWFPWLVLLDQGWTKEAKERIFPKEEKYQDYFDTAWETYITFCHAYSNVFSVIQDVYAIAVGKIGSWPDDGFRLADPDDSLTEHLMVYYWRGLIETDNPTDLLPAFYEAASDELRGKAIDFIGLSFEQATKGIDANTKDRVRKLWEWRLGVAKKADDKDNYQKELSAFGHWFASGKDDNAWLLGQLIEVLKFASWVEPDHMVIKRLAELSESFPEEVVICLDLMVQGDKEGWRMHGWREHTRTILKTAIDSINHKARENAIDLVHRLGALGNFEYRDLVPKE